MVDDDRDVLVSFLIAGLVNADIYEVVRPSGTLRLNVVQCPVDAPSHRLPVDAHVLGYGTSGKICRKPSDREVKVLCKAAARICPWDICRYDTVFRTIDAVGMPDYLNNGSTPVKGSPAAGSFNGLVVVITMLMAKRTIILVPCVGTGIDLYVVHPISIRIKILSCNNCLVDIE